MSGHASKILVLATSRTIDLKRDLGSSIQWLDANRFKTCRTRHRIDRQAPDAPTTTTIQVFETDLRTTTTNLVHEYSKLSEIPWIVLAGLRYAMHENRLLDLESGKSVVLPRVKDNVYSLFDWNEKLEQIVYPADFPNGEKGDLAQTLIVFDPKKGIREQIDFHRPQKFESLKFSPNGNQLFVRRSCHSRLIVSFLSNSQAEIRDLKNQRCRRLAVNMPISAQTFMFATPSYLYAQRPSWTPDGSAVVYDSTNLRKLRGRTLQYDLVLAEIGAD